VHTRIARQIDMKIHFVFRDEARVPFLGGQFCWLRLGAAPQQQKTRELKEQTVQATPESRAMRKW
jgi:hypothetical protein